MPWLALPASSCPAFRITSRNAATGGSRHSFSDGDYALYRDLLQRHCRVEGVAVWSWVLMPNHVHLVLVPAHEDGLRAALSKVHRTYAGHIHARERRTGHFWQGRFGCVAMDDEHLAAAIPYVVLNPVRARRVERAVEWRWSSIHALLDPARGDGLTEVAPVLERLGDVAALIAGGEDLEAVTRRRRAETIGRPLGDAAFMDRVVDALGRCARPKPRGRRKSALSP
jgi:putative transposase